LSHAEAGMDGAPYHDTMIWPSFAFPLAACTFSLAEAKLTKELRKLTVLKLGIARSFLHAFLHALLCFQGLHFPHVTIEQGVQQIGKMLTHGDTGSPTSKWLMLTLEQAQLEVGIGVPLMEAPFEQYGFLCTDCWIKSLWWFVSTYDILLTDRDYKVPPLQREGDEFIMERLVMSERFNEEVLIRINRCRIKKQVLTMADIMAGDGVHLQRDVHVYTHPFGVPTSKYDWAKEEPASRDWTLWRYATKAVTSENGTLPFFDSLGKWISPPHWPSEWLYSTTTRLLYRDFMGGFYRFYPRAGTRWTTYLSTSLAS